MTNVLDRGDASRPPSCLAPGLGATVCRSVLPITSTGAFAPAPGAPVPPNLARDDPRWTRPLPWTIGPAHDAVGSPLLAVSGLALFNVFLPLLILRLVAFRRPWTMRLLMMLPVAAAAPLTAFSVVEPLIPTLPSPYTYSSRTIFFMGSLVGVPIVCFVAAAAWALVRRRWRQLALLAGITLLASLAIGVIWLWLDFRSMPAIERFTWSGWYMVLIAGAYAVGALLPGFAAMSRFMRGRPTHSISTLPLGQGVATN
jgi:hypothetical protein